MDGKSTDRAANTDPNDPNLRQASDWPEVPNAGGPYGYSLLIVEEGGIRLSCGGKVVNTKDEKDIYSALVREQRKLIWARPKTFAAAERLVGSNLAAYFLRKISSSVLGGLEKLLTKLLLGGAKFPVKS